MVERLPAAWSPRALARTKVCRRRAKALRSNWQAALPARQCVLPGWQTRCSARSVARLTGRTAIVDCAHALSARSPPSGVVVKEGKPFSRRDFLAIAGKAGALTAVAPWLKDGVFVPGSRVSGE